MNSEQRKQQQYPSPSQTMNMESLCATNDLSLLTKDSFNSHEILQNFLKNFQSFATPINAFKQGQKQLIKDNIQFCPNHPTKLARYYTSSNQEKKVCSKCALKFALQGEQIKEDLNEEGQILNYNNTIKEHFRKQQTEQFLQKLKYMVKDNEDIQNMLNNKEKELSKHYSLQTKLINNQFKQIQLHLVEYKGELLKKLNNFQQEQQITFDELNSITKTSAHEIQIVLNDVLKNYDDIVKDIATGPFINILNQYTQKLLMIQSGQSKAKSANFQTLEIDQSIQSQLNSNKLIESVFKHSIQSISLFEPLNIMTTQKKRQTVHQNRDKSLETKGSQGSIKNKHQPFKLSISNILNNALSDEKENTLQSNYIQTKNYKSIEDYCQFNSKYETRLEDYQVQSPRQDVNKLFSGKALQFIGENQKRKRDILGSLQTESNSITQLFDGKINDLNVTTAKFNYANNKKISYNRKKYQTPDDQYLLPKTIKLENDGHGMNDCLSKTEMNYSSCKEKKSKDKNNQNNNQIKHSTQKESKFAKEKKSIENIKKQNKSNILTGKSTSHNSNNNNSALKILKNFLPGKCKNYTELFQQTKKPFKQIQIINLNSFNQNNCNSSEQ